MLGSPELQVPLAILCTLSSVLLQLICSYILWQQVPSQCIRFWLCMQHRNLILACMLCFQNLVRVPSLGCQLMSASCCALLTLAEGFAAELSRREPCMMHDIVRLNLQRLAVMSKMLTYAVRDVQDSQSPLWKPLVSCCCC